MPTSVIINGKRVFIPGIYAHVDASALSGKGISTGNVAVVGDFPSLEKNTLYWFTSPQALRSWDPADLTLARLAKLLFSPAVDDVISGANKVLLVSGNTNTQAHCTFPDVDSVASIDFKSRKWGPKGNQVHVHMTSSGTSTAAKRLLNVDISAEGQTESYTGLGSGDVASFKLDTSVCKEMSGAASTSTVAVDKTALSWLYSCRLLSNFIGPVSAALPAAADPVATVLWTNMVVSGAASATLSAVIPAGLCVATLITHGKDTGGATATGYAVFAAGDGLVAKTFNTNVDGTGAPILWSRIDSITLDTAGADPTAATKVDVSGAAFSLTMADFTMVSDVLGFINNFAAKGWAATSLLPITAAIPANQIDKLTATTVKDAALLVRADIWAIVAGLQASNLVEVYRNTAAVKAPNPWNQVPTVVVEDTLFGGTQTAAVSTGYEDAFAQITNEDIQWVVALSTDVAMLKAARQHCVDSAIAGSERAAFGGAASNTSLADLLTNFTAALGSRHIAVCGQDIQITGPLGKAEWLTPEYQAVQLAGMKAGSDVAEPLTNKRPDVLDVRGSWTVQKDDNEVIEKAILAYTKSHTGIKVLRSVTTWLTDDNPAYCEVSANESINVCIRTLRAGLESSLGKKANIPINVFKINVERRLDQMVRDQVIKAWRNVVIEPTADKYRIDFDVAPIFPFNFAEIWAHVGDFSV